MIARYGEVINVLVKKGEKVIKGQKIAEVGLLIPHVIQPAREESRKIKRAENDAKWMRENKRAWDKATNPWAPGSKL